MGYSLLRPYGTRNDLGGVAFSTNILSLRDNNNAVSLTGQLLTLISTLTPLPRNCMSIDPNGMSIARDCVETSRNGMSFGRDCVEIARDGVEIVRDGVEIVRDGVEIVRSFV